MKKRIIFSAVDIGGGGAERILLNILQNLSRDKFDISLLLFEKYGIFLKEIPADVKLHYFVSPDWFPLKIRNLYWKFFRKIAFRFFMYFPNIVYKICGCKHYDVDIAFLQDTSYLLRAGRGKYKIAWIHTNIKYSPTLANNLHDNLVVADKIVGVSNGVSNKVVEVFPDLKSKIMTIYNPSPLQNILKLSTKKHVSYSKTTIIAVGRLKKPKSYDKLIAAFKILIDKGYDWELKILGEGELYSELSTQIRSLGLQNSVELLGFQQNPYPYMRAANLFAMSSSWEGFGQVIVEALVLGVPVVSTDCEFGPREILQDGKFGTLVPVGDIELLATAIEEKLLTNNDLRSQVSKGLEHVKCFDLPVVISQIENLLESSN